MARPSEDRPIANTASVQPITETLGETLGAFGVAIDAGKLEIRPILELAVPNWPPYGGNRPSAAAVPEPAARP